MACRALLLAALLAGLLPSPAGAQPAAAKPLTAKAPADTLDGPPNVSAKAWAIADGKSGKYLWGVHEAEPRPMASTQDHDRRIVLQLAE